MEKQSKTKNLIHQPGPHQEPGTIFFNMVILCYKTDFQHSYASRDLIAIALTKGIAIRLCEEQAKKDGEEINEEQLWNLDHLCQTQGHTGEYEFDLDIQDTNKLF